MDLSQKPVVEGVTRGTTGNCPEAVVITDGMDQAVVRGAIKSG